MSVRALRAFADAIEFHGRDPTTPFEITVDETPPRPPLTEAQKRVYGTLVKHYQETGRTPTLREVCKRMGTKSSHGIWEQLRRLERKTYIRVEPGIARGITLLGGMRHETDTKSETPEAEDATREEAEDRVVALAGKEIAYVVLHDAFVEGHGWRLAICVKGEKGYSPTGTWPFEGKVGQSYPIFVKGTYEDAQKRVDALNARLGLTPKEAAILVAGTF